MEPRHHGLEHQAAIRPRPGLTRLRCAGSADRSPGNADLRPLQPLSAPNPTPGAAATARIIRGDQTQSPVRQAARKIAEETGSGRIARAAVNWGHSRYWPKPGERSCPLAFAWARRALCAD